MLLNPVLASWLARGEKEERGRPRPPASLPEDAPPPDQIAALGALKAKGKLTPEVLGQAGRSPQWLVRLATAALGGKAEPVNAGGKEWFTRLQTALDAESVWGLKPCHATRDGLEALQEGLARMPDRRVAGGLNLLEAVVAHYTAHDIEIEVGARVVVGEDSFEIAG